jgi:serine/threonine protein phosphatase PrpC
VLIEKANAQGGRDNITTILVRVDDAKGAVTRTASG